MYLLDSVLCACAAAKTRVRLSRPSDTRMKTRIVNETPHNVELKEGNAGVYRSGSNIPRSKTYTLELPSPDPLTYREWWVETVCNGVLIFSSDDFLEAEEIIIYETIENTIACRISEARGSRQQHSAIQDEKALFALRTEVYSKIKVMETSREELRESLEQVKVCPVQCHNLAQTCLDGTEKLKSTFNALNGNANQLWGLYYSRKLPYLISSLMRLLSTLGSCNDLLQACGSKWCRMALVLSIPPSAKKRLSKFDRLTNELSWNLDTIDYALYWTPWNREFKWNASSCRYVYEKKLVPTSSKPGVIQQPLTEDYITLPPETELSEKSEELVCRDREHLLRNLQNGSPLTRENFALDLMQAGKASWGDYISSVSRIAWKYFYLRDTADRWRESLAAILIKRLQETSDLSNKSVPDCFRINLLDLEIEDRLYGEDNIKGIHKGKWCGQAAAIKITSEYVSNSTGRADFEREAAILLNVQHPNIVDFFGCAVTDDYSSSLLSDGSDKVCKGYLVMELMQEDLHKVIDRRAKTQLGSPFPVAVALYILLQIVAAMIHVHSLDIMHRDLKAANCLVRPRSGGFFTVKLADFGESKELDAAISNHTVNVGTRRWMAPEVLGEPGQEVHEPYTTSADVYSFAMTCYEIITGKEPFYLCCRVRDLLNLLKEGRRPDIVIFQLVVQKV